MSLRTSSQLESNVRYYPRLFPTVFSQAKGSWQWDESGTPYLDFFCGAGALNYGHNEPFLKERLLHYIQHDFVTHTLDMESVAKRQFVETFQRLILAPRTLDYKLQFPAPTGTNAVEAALKLARKVTGRKRILAFDNAYHGLTLGALATTANPTLRKAAGVSLPDVTFLPYGTEENEDEALEQLSEYLFSVEEKPAAAIVETIQGEGGIHIASVDWLQRLERLLKEHGVLLILDDIQTGCGRTGTFFSFETIGLQPDIILLSKSLSGLGLPMSLVLLKPGLDQWEPGEHSGTFRGFNHAFVTATAALETFWADDTLQLQLQQKTTMARERLERLEDKFCYMTISARGRGLMMAVDFGETRLAPSAQQAFFNRQAMAVTAGHKASVIKLLPSLLVTEEELHDGFDRLEDAIEEVI